MRIVKISIVVLMAAVLSYSGVGIGQQNPAKEVPAKEVPPEKIKRIAVMDFQNKTGEDELLPTCKAIALLLLSDLSSVKGIMTLERERVSDAISELNLGEDGFLNPATAPKAQKAIGADYMVEGAILKKDKDLAFKVRVILLETGRTIFEEEFSGKLNELLKIEKTIYEKIGKLIEDDKAKPAAKQTQKIGHLTIAVMPFEDLSPENRTGSLAEMLQYTIESEISQIQEVSVLTREHLNEILEEQKMAMSGLMEKKNAIKIGQIVGVKYLLFGSITLVGKELRADVRVMSVESGEIVYTANSTAGLSDIDSLSKGVTIKILEGLYVNLLKVDREDIERGAEANTEARYHLDAAIKMKEGNWSVVGRDEVEALQRVVFLDALDAGADLFLIDKMIESQMYVEAARKIRKALERKLPKETEGELWHKLAQCYDQKGELAILWHITKNYPGTRAAIKANWLLGYQYYCDEKIQDYVLGAQLLKEAFKDIKTLKEILPEKNRTQVDYMKGQHLITGFGIPPFTSQYVIDRIIGWLERYDKLDEIDMADVHHNIENFCKEYAKRNYAAALPYFKKFGHYLPESDRLYRCYTYNLILCHLFEEAIEVQEIRLESEKKYFLARDLQSSERSPSHYIAILEYRRDIWKLCNPNNSKLPDYNPNRKKKLLASLTPLENYLYGYVFLSIKKYPNDVRKAYANTELLITNHIKRYKNNVISNYSAVKYAFLLVCLQNDVKLALDFINTYYPGKTFEEKYASLPRFVNVWFAHYYAERMEYKNALKFYQIAYRANENQHDWIGFSGLSMMIYKLCDYENALQILKNKFGSSFTRKPKDIYDQINIQKEKIAGEATRIEKSEYGDPVFLAAKCYDDLADYVNAYNNYARFIKNADNSPQKEFVLGAEERLKQLEAILLKQNPNDKFWKVGDWWEGVQGWFVSNPANKNLPEGWLFTDMYFEVDRIEKVSGIDCYVLDIYNKTRAEVLAAVENGRQPKKDALKFISVYVTKATKMPFDFKLGQGCLIPENKITPHKDQIIPFEYLMRQSAFSVMPLAEAPQDQPAANFVFALPFNSVLPEWIADDLKSSVNNNIIIQNNPVNCHKTVINAERDFNIMGYVNLIPNEVDFNDTNAIEMYGKFPDSTYLCEQYWQEEFPWWVRVAEYNKWFVNGKSPDCAKYSKLFVLTNYNGLEVSVDTGLGGKFSDIKKLRESYGDFAQKYPYRDIASRENEEAIEYAIRFHKGTDFYTNSRIFGYLSRNKKMVGKYLAELFDREDNQGGEKACYRILHFMVECQVSEEVFMECLAKFINDPRPNRMKYYRLNAIQMFYTDSEETKDSYFSRLSRKPDGLDKGYDFIMKCIHVCEERQYDSDSIWRMIRWATSYRNYRSVHILVDYYKKRKSVGFLNAALELIDKQRYSRPPLMVNSSQAEIQEYIDLLEAWCEADERMERESQNKGD